MPCEYNVVFDWKIQVAEECPLDSIIYTHIIHAWKIKEYTPNY